MGELRPKAPLHLRAKKARPQSTRSVRSIARQPEDSFRVKPLLECQNRPERSFVHKPFEAIPAAQFTDVLGGILSVRRILPDARKRLHGRPALIELSDVALAHRFTHEFGDGFRLGARGCGARSTVDRPGRAAFASRCIVYITHREAGIPEVLARRTTRQRTPSVSS